MDDGIERCWDYLWDSDDYCYLFFIHCHFFIFYFQNIALKLYQKLISAREIKRIAGRFSSAIEY